VATRRVCIVTNFNYSGFLPECLASVLNQTLPFQSVLVVDDGSTDDSRYIIAQHAERAPNLVPILKENAGQLSCFNAAAPYIQANDLVWFIDADDVYARDYAENTAPLFQAADVDCVFVNPIIFTSKDDAPASCHVGAEKHVYLPMTSAVTRATQSWFGAPTSCLALRGSTLLSLLPYPYEQDWKIRADDVIVYASSIAGARKLYGPSLGVGYRRHGNNHFLGRHFEAAQFVSREFHLERLFGWYEQKFGLNERPALARVMREIALVPKIYRKQFHIPSTTKMVLHRLFGSLPSVAKRILTFKT
jgi:glycosyltransferase involved in cell wall biosynthesis